MYSESYCIAKISMMELLTLIYVIFSTAELVSSQYYKINSHNHEGAQSRRDQTRCRLSTGQEGFCAPPNKCRPHQAEPHRRIFMLHDSTCWHLHTYHICCPNEDNRSSGSSNWFQWFQNFSSTRPNPPDLEVAEMRRPYMPWFRFTTSSTTAAPTTKASLRPSEGIRFNHPNRRLLPVDSCGPELGTGNRIVGGKDADIGEFPWTVLLLYRFRSKRIGAACGGTLISARYVMTAAHCIRPSKMKAQLIRVRLGEYDTNQNPDCRNGLCGDPIIDVDIEDSIIHPDYQRQVDTSPNDIALLRLKTPVQISRYISPICLPLDEFLNKSYDGQKLVVAGWGRTERSSSSDIKQILALPVVDMGECSQQYRRLGNVELENTQICAGGEKDKDSCQGDSGGPLMADEFVNGQVKWYQIGIVSYGPESCGKLRIPGVYTKVAPYVRWILDNLKN